MLNFHEGIGPMCIEFLPMIFVRKVLCKGYLTYMYEMTVS